jgi:hypothetical protein
VGAPPSCRAFAGPRTDATGTCTGTRQQRRANEGANTDANADTPPLFRRALQNLAAAAMLLCGFPQAVTFEE